MRSRLGVEIVVSLLLTAPKIHYCNMLLTLGRNLMPLQSSFTGTLRHLMFPLGLSRWGHYVICFFVS